MTEQDYKDERLKVCQQALKDLSDLKSAYAREHNEVAIGDFITNGLIIIKVERIAVVVCGRSYSNAPECRYYGARYIKGCSRPYKTGEASDMLQRNLASL